MREKAEQLDNDGKHEDANRVREEIKAIVAKVSSSRSASGGAGGGEINTAELRQHLQAMREKAEQLDNDGKHEDANRVREEIKAIIAKVSSSRSASGGPSAKRIEMSDSDREKLQSMRRKIEELEKDGRHDEAARVKQEAKELYSKYSPRHGDSSGQTTNPASSPSPGEIANRLQHLRVAVDHLHAAGFEPEANHVHELVERLERYSRGEGRSPNDSKSSEGREKSSPSPEKPSSGS